MVQQEQQEDFEPMYRAWYSKYIREIRSLGSKCGTAERSGAYVRNLVQQVQHGYWEPCFRTWYRRYSRGIGSLATEHGTAGKAGRSGD